MTSLPSTTGETDLSTLLTSLRPKLHPEVYCFVTIPTKSVASFPGVATWSWELVTSRFEPLLDNAVMTFRELHRESITVITLLRDAQKLQESLQSESFEFGFPSRMIALDVHSSLDAVGFLAFLGTELAKRANMGANPVSGFYSDHLFVHVDYTQQAMDILGEIAEEAENKETAEENS